MNCAKKQLPNYGSKISRNLYSLYRAKRERRASGSEREFRLRLITAWREKVRTAEIRKKIVKRHAITDIENAETQAQGVPIALPQVIESASNVEDVPRNQAGRIQVIILCTQPGDNNSGRAETSC